MAMRGQLDVGRRQFYSFTPLREAHLKRLRDAAANSPLLHQKQPLLTSATSSSLLHLSPSHTLSPLLPLTSSSTHLLQTHRPFLTSLREKLKLKTLERAANADPTNPTPQYHFLSELSRTSHHAAVVERFEHYPQFAADQRCAGVYLDSLRRTGGDKNFSLEALLARLVKDGRTDPAIVEALEASKGETGRGAPRSALAQKAASVLAGVGGVTAAGPAVAGLGGMGMIGRGMYGGDPSTPLYVQYAGTRVNFQEQMWKTVRAGLTIFLLVSAVGVLLDGRGMGNAIGMGGKHVQEAEGSSVRFDDIKGVEEAKAELEEIVLYLKDPQRFTRLGGKLPRGLLLTGPPGTGKTMLAKAIAGEAGVPFFFSSGSQFEEVYVGLGAKRVRELFEAAKKKAPAIIFIDEIDAVGGSRKLKDQSALKMTLNELLVQMDGFEENNGIIVVGATNFAQSLDKALLRPGRFDKHVTVPLPDVGGRKEILAMYALKTKLNKDVDLDVLARGTTGFSGADLYNLMNQAALKASVDGANSIDMKTMEYAKDKIIMGAERKTAVITKENARNTAYHEAGHALVAVLTEGADQIHKATIMPRGNSLGMVTQLPSGDQTSLTHKEMLARLDVCMGGRVAEELAFGKENITSGASSDIAQATRMARAMVTKWGFSDQVGFVYHEGETGEGSASVETRGKIDEEVKKLTSDAYQRASDLLRKYKKEHSLLAETLLEYETLTGDEIRDVILRHKKPSRPIINQEGGARGDQSILNEKKVGGLKTKLAASSR